MGTTLWILLILFIIISAATVMIILVQRPQGGGLAGAFGGAGGTSSDTVFGGRVGDALTWATIGSFTLYLGLAIALNMFDSRVPAVADTPSAANVSADGSVPTTSPSPANAPPTNAPAPSGLDTLTPVPEATRIETSPAIPPADEPASEPDPATGDPAPETDTPAEQAQPEGAE